MPEKRLASGITIRVPEALLVSEHVPFGPSPRGGRKFALGPTPIRNAASPAADTDALLTAIEQQELRLIDSFEVQPTLEATPASGQRRRGASSVPSEQAIEIDVELNTDENALLLIEQEGMFAWHFPEPPIARSAEVSPAAPTPATPTRKAPPQSAQFRLPLHSQQPSAGATRRGLVGDFVYNRIRIHALKFAARLLIGRGVKFLERNVRRGFIQMQGIHIQEWKPATAAQLRFPADHSPRILLFVHGTFSSTIGSFGALCGTPWGQAFLSAAAAHYDAVIGFDHATLSEDPIGNASELLSCLESLNAKYPPEIDAIAFSRGGLVLRSLIDHLLPKSQFKGRVRRAIFVACTNAGTKLASPDNWHTLLDIYTNTAVAAFRLLSMLPQMAAPAVVLKEIVQSIGVFAKCLAVHAMSDIPGLAAMQTDGDFVKALNQIQPGQPSADEALYYVVTSNFKPRLLEDDHFPREFPLRFVTLLTNGLIDQLMGAPNDLVVDTASMASIDPVPGGYIKDTFDFGTTASVYHTCYFTRPEVINACTRWLRLPVPQSEVLQGRIELTIPKRSVSRGGSVASRPGIMVPAPLSGSAWSATSLPVSVDTDIIVSPAAANAKDVAEFIDEKSPSYIVITRSYAEKTLMYAFRTEEVLSQMKTPEAEHADMMSLMNLHETDASEMQSVSATGPVENPGTASLTARRGVVLSEGTPIGVVPEQEQAPAAIDIIDLAQRTAQASSSIKDRILLRRAMPSFAPPVETPKPAKVRCHFLAEMESQVQTNHVTTIEVSVSQEAVAAAMGRLSSGATGIVEAAGKIIVQVIPKANFDIVDSDRVEIDIPQPGEPAVYYFDLKATNPGEGEIWVVVRQRQSNVARLVLRPNILDKKRLSTTRIRAEDLAVEAPVLEQPLNQLTIIEQINGAETRYFYEIEFPKLNLFRTFFSAPLKTDRMTYINTCYRNIEDRWISNYDKQKHTADIEAFTKELQAIGAGLFEELLPSELQRILWDRRDGLQSIRIVSTEPLIPWEVVHLKEPGTQGLGNEMRFLAQMGLVRWLHNVDGLPPKELAIRRDKSRYVIPDYKREDIQLPETKRERDFLEQQFGATAIEPQPNPVRKALEQPGGFDLLHFAGHGEAESDNIVDARIVLEDRIEGPHYVNTFLSATTVEHFAKLRAPNGSQPIVVLNACQVGRAGYRLTGIGGFAQAFLRGGAGIFVGTLWSVGDFPSRIFTEEFYVQLKDHHKTLAEATIAAREKARSAGDATWLAYVVYGHPHARLRMK